MRLGPTGWQTPIWSSPNAIIAERKAERDRCNTIVRKAWGDNYSVDTMEEAAKIVADRASASITEASMNSIELTRPIIGIENRTAQEVFDIMSDRIRGALSVDLPSLYAEIAKNDERIAKLEAAMELILCMHDGNPPLPLADMSEIDYARRTISNIHREARAALQDGGSDD